MTSASPFADRVVSRSKRRPFMTWHNKHGTGRVADDVFGRAAEEQMLESGSAVRCGDNEIGAELLSFCADLLPRVAAGDNTFEREIIALIANKLAHLLSGEYFRLLREHRKVVARVFVERDVIFQMHRVQQKQLRFELPGQAPGVIDTRGCAF